MSAAEKLPEWPPSHIGWLTPVLPVAASKLPPQRPMRPSDFGPGWTPEGLETLRRVLARAVRGGGR